MAARIQEEEIMRRFAVAVLVWLLNMNLAPAQAKGEPSPASSSCGVEATNYKGWSAHELSNRWLKLEVVPQNGGRLMQVIFNGHPFLFVNPKYEGKYLPPDPTRWFNYGGDKLWLLPEGNDNEQEWVGNSDLLDDGPYTFRKVSEGQECEIELVGPADPQTGIQIRRTIHLDADSPRIRFHATMQNKTGHVIEWSMQSVSQYNTGDSSTPARSNPQFLDFHSRESNEQLSEPLPRSLRPSRESSRLRQRRWSLRSALCSPRRRTVARLDVRLAGGGGWR